MDKSRDFRRILVFDRVAEIAHELADITESMASAYSVKDKQELLEYCQSHANDLNGYQTIESFAKVSEIVLCETMLDYVNLLCDRIAFSHGLSELPETLKGAGFTKMYPLPILVSVFASAILMGVVNSSASVGTRICIDDTRKPVGI